MISYQLKERWSTKSSLFRTTCVHDVIVKFVFFDSTCPAWYWKNMYNALYKIVNILDTAVTNDKHI